MNVKEQLTIHIIVGPTASGKSAYALDLARCVNGVVINCDSMQIYKDLHILTAQPPAEDRQDAPHRLYGLFDSGEVCSAGRWRDLAAAEIESAFEKGQTPILCGGTGLYVKALMEGLSPIPEIPEDVRQGAMALYARLGGPDFHAQLAARDPVIAARLEPLDSARLIRAWEIWEGTGHSPLYWQGMDKNAPPPHWDFRVHKILPQTPAARENLRVRCNARFEAMLENGALAEVEEFDARIQKGEVNEHAPITRALGFKPLQAYVRGDLSRKEAVEKAQAQTRQYAKRQMTWFRNQM